MTDGSARHTPKLDAAHDQLAEGSDIHSPFLSNTRLMHSLKFAIVRTLDVVIRCCQTRAAASDPKPANANIILRAVAAREVRP
jgi:hypothetical protein